MPDRRQSVKYKTWGKLESGGLAVPLDFYDYEEALAFAEKHDLYLMKETIEFLRDPIRRQY